MKLDGSGPGAAAPPIPSSSSSTSSSSSHRQLESLVRLSTLVLIYIMAFSARLFSVIRYESIIHEFDPWFNYRATKMLVEQGTYAFWDWFDSGSWYPLGRVVGGTVYPGIMYTAAVIYHFLHFIGFQHVHIREVCVLTAPIFSGLTAVSAYLLGKEAFSTGAGMFAAVIISIVPGYMQRSAAGSYDNEAVAITALVFVMYMFMKAVNTGSIMWSVMSSLAYMYMVSTWGGYIFVINVIPIYVLVMLVIGRYSHRLYVSYTIFYVIGTLLAMQIRFVHFRAVQSKENLGAMGVFVLLNLYVFARWLASNTSKELFYTLLTIVVVSMVVSVGIFLVYAFSTGFFGPWEGRFYTILDPTYASKYIPIIASVSEHQPTAWGSYFLDLHVLNFFFPVGLYFVMKNLSDTNLLLVVYAAFAAYFSGVMSRLMLVLAPASALLSGVAMSSIVTRAVLAIKGAGDEKRDQTESGVAVSAISQATLVSKAEPSVEQRTPSKSQRKGSSAVSSTGIPAPLPSRPALKFYLSREAGMVAIVIVGYALFKYIQHCLYMANHAYSSPSVVLQVGDGLYWDDFREAYYWLNQNTNTDDKVLSWWDYGYQLNGMSNRTTIVDNNTWNNSHIATVGRALNSPEKKAHTICRKLDAKYVLVLFGGMVGYSSDDINKFLWPVRISGSVDPSVKEEDYLANNGHYVTEEGSAGAALVNSLLYRLSYYRFNEVRNHQSGAVDLVRQHRAPTKKIKLKYFEEAYTTEHWLVRIFRVKDTDNRGFV